MVTDSSYMRSIPPPPLPGEEKTFLIVDVDILTILEIMEVDNLISLQLEVKITWVDSRLVMLDLHDDTSMNVITESTRTNIWLPEVLHAIVTVGRHLPLQSFI